MARRTWTRTSSTREGSGSELGGLPLRQTLNATLAFLLVLPLATAAALALVTTFLHRAVTELGNEVESTRIAGAMQVELIADDRAATIALLEGEDATFGRAATAAEARLGRLLLAAAPYADDQERVILKQASDAIADYLSERKALTPSRVPAKAAITRLGAKFGPAFAALEDLLAHDAEDVRIWQKRAARWDRLADTLSVVAALLAALAVLVTFFGLRARVHRPLLELHAVVSAFATGDTMARATATGARELREMSATFNHLAQNIEQEERGRLVQVSDTVQAIRDPLTVINLWAERTNDALAPLVPPSVSLIRKQVRRIEQVLRDALDLALIRGGTLELKTSRADLRDSARHVVDAFRAESHCELSVSVPDEPVFAQCDRPRIEHVITTLLCNALRMSPAGGPIVVSAREDGEHAILEVADQGIGMSPDECTRLFEPFAWTGFPREPFSGAGLGLWATRRIVEAHRGEIEVDTAPGEGSTFRVLLPLPAHHEAHEERTPSALIPPQSGAHA